MALLGAVRDADVLGQRLAEAVGELEEGPDREAGALLLSRLGVEREPLLAALHEGLDHDRYLALVDALVELALHPPLLADAEASARRALPVLAATPWSHLERNIGKLETAPDR